MNKITELKPITSETANLRQIIEWVAFQLEPLEPAYNNVFRKDINEYNNKEEINAILMAKKNIFIALREGYLAAYANVNLIVDYNSNCSNENYINYLADPTSNCKKGFISKNLWSFNNISWQSNSLLYMDKLNPEDPDVLLEAYEISVKAADMYELFPAPIKHDKIVTLSESGQQNHSRQYWIDFPDLSNEVILNDIFSIAAPEINGQNYKIIRYLIKNPNRFITVHEIKEKALEGKELDKRLTDFVAQVNLNKDFGKLFFDTGKDSIRLNNPVSSERMAEKSIRRLRIKPA